MRDDYSYPESSEVDIGRYHINTFISNETIHLTGSDIFMLRANTAGVNYIGTPDSPGDEKERYVLHTHEAVMSFTEITNRQFADVMNVGISRGIIDVLDNNRVVLVPQNLDTALASFIKVGKMSFEANVLALLTEAERAFVTDMYKKEVPSKIKEDQFTFKGDDKTFMESVYIYDSGSEFYYIKTNLTKEDIEKIWITLEKISYSKDMYYNFKISLSDVEKYYYWKILVNNNKVSTLKLFAIDQNSINYIDALFIIDNNRGNYPVTKVSWYGAAVFCNILSELKGYSPVYNYNHLDESDHSQNGYRLPAEAEFEIACRGNGLYSKYTYLINNDPLTVNDINLSGYLKEIYTFNGYINPANFDDRLLDHRLAGYGFADILGNVQEWTEDNYQADCGQLVVNPSVQTLSGIKVIKGGGYLNSAEEIYCSKRTQMNIENFSTTVGFRIIRQTEKVFNGN